MRWRWIADRPADPGSNPSPDPNSRAHSHAGADSNPYAGSGTTADTDGRDVREPERSQQRLVRKADGALQRRDLELLTESLRHVLVARGREVLGLPWSAVLRQLVLLGGAVMFKLFRRPLLLLGVLLFAGAQMATPPIGHAASCTPWGKGKCTACKSCKSCGHCAKGGGTCSVCR
jgi:hypothetical protein